MTDPEIITRIKNALQNDETYKRNKENSIKRFKEVNAAFIERGFVSIDAKIKFGEMFGGVGSYDRYAKMQTDPVAFDYYRDLSDDVFKQLAQFECDGKEKPKDYYYIIKNHPELVVSSKEKLLRRFFPQEYFDDFKEFIPMLKDARMEEQARLAKVWGDKPRVRLYGEETLALRKEVFNSVMLDAFGAHGFTKRSTKSGVISMHKALTEHYGVMTYLDFLTIKTQWQDFGEEWDDWYGAGHIGFSAYFGDLKSGKGVSMGHSIPFRSYIDDIGHFRTPQEMEVSIRAQALRYELFIKPFEEIIKASVARTK